MIGEKPIEEGGGENGVLVLSIDSKKGGIDSKEIEDLINQFLNKPLVNLCTFVLYNKRTISQTIVGFYEMYSY